MLYVTDFEFTPPRDRIDRIARAHCTRRRTALGAADAPLNFRVASGLTVEQRVTGAKS
jgi:hypothetical protein